MWLEGRLSLVGYGGNQLDLETAPIAEPLTLNEAKLQVRRTTVEDDDEYLADVLIPAVREHAEQATRRQFITATWDLKLDRWPCQDDQPMRDRDAYPQGVIRVPLPPLQEVVFIKYVDTNGVEQTWASSNYLVDAPIGPRAYRGRIVPAYNAEWPFTSTRDQVNAITVRFVAGYGDTPADVPPKLKMAMLENLGTAFEHREDYVVGQGYAITPFPQGSEAKYRAFTCY